MKYLNSTSIAGLGEPGFGIARKSHRPVRVFARSEFAAVNRVAHIPIDSARALLKRLLAYRMPHDLAIGVEDLKRDVATRRHFDGYPMLRLLCACRHDLFDHLRRKEFVAVGRIMVHVVCSFQFYFSSLAKDRELHEPWSDAGRRGKDDKPHGVGFSLRRFAVVHKQVDVVL